MPKVIDQQSVNSNKNILEKNGSKNMLESLKNKLTRTKSKNKAEQPVEAVEEVMVDNKQESVEKDVKLESPDMIDNQQTEEQKNIEIMEQMLSKKEEGKVSVEANQPILQSENKSNLGGFSSSTTQVGQTLLNNEQIQDSSGLSILTNMIIKQFVGTIGSLLGY